jgi:SAM-dependent methyltransferase
VSVDDERMVLSRSFGAIAEQYARYRPAPPAAIVDWALPDHEHVIVDIGAGTGALTWHLVGRTDVAIAVEPDARMAAVLTERVPSAVVTAGRAEQLPLRDASVDAVAGSSMWHWVDEPRGLTEIARVLRPGGVLALIRNSPDWSAGPLGEIMRRGRRRRPEPDGAAPEGRGRGRYEIDLSGDERFEQPETHVHEWTKPMTRDELVGLAGTYSGVIIQSDADRDRVQAELTSALAGHAAFGAAERIDVPMRCACWRAVRAG